MKGWCVAMSSVSKEEFGKDLGVVHEAVVTGRKVGAGRDFWAALAHSEELFKKVMGLVGMIFFIIIDYSRSLLEMIAAGNYDWVNGDITAEHFPVQGEGTVPADVRLYHFGRTRTSEAVLAEMDKDGYEPGKIEELLAFGEKYPDKQREFSIVCLGSRWQDPSGDVLVPVLDRYASKRDLDLCVFESDWLECARFLAVRKHQSR